MHAACSASGTIPATVAEVLGTGSKVMEAAAVLRENGVKGFAVVSTIGRDLDIAVPLLEKGITTSVSDVLGSIISDGATLAYEKIVANLYSIHSMPSPVFLALVMPDGELVYDQAKAAVDIKAARTRF